MQNDFKPDPSLRDRVLAQASQHPVPTRDVHTRRARLGYAAALVLSLVIFQASGGLEHGAGRPAHLTAIIALGSLLVAGIAARLALTAGPSMLGRHRAVYAILALSLPVVTYGWLTAFAGQYVEPFQRVGWRCVGLTLAIAGVVLVAALRDRRHSVVHHAGWQGAAIGGAAAAWASVLVDLWCPLTNVAHVAFGHVLPVVLLIAVGTVLGPRILAIRPVVGETGGQGAAKA